VVDKNVFPAHAGMNRVEPELSPFDFPLSPFNWNVPRTGPGNPISRTCIERLSVLSRQLSVRAQRLQVDTGIAASLRSSQ
jgi:hypothetical protein